MGALARILFGLIASTLAATAVVAALVMGVATLWPLLGVAAAGVVAAVPLTIIVARLMAKD